MVIKKGGLPCGNNNDRDRGDSVIIEEISANPWKIQIDSAEVPTTPMSVASKEPQQHQQLHQHHQHQQNIRHVAADSSGDSGQIMSHSFIIDENDDDDMYLQPKVSVSSQHSHNSHHQGKISISSHNNFAIQTHELINNHELIEGNEIDTVVNIINNNIENRINNNYEDEQKREYLDGHKRHLTGGNNMDIEDEYEWIELAFRTIDENDWKQYLNRFKKNKVTTQRLNSLITQDIKELIPEIGIRREFITLLKQRNN